MLKPYLFIFLAILSLLNACSDSNSQNAEITELEGDWKGACTKNFYNLATNGIDESVSVVLSYNKNNVYANVRNYNDSNCTSLISSTPARFTFYEVLSPETPLISFSIGKSVNTINGVTVKELIYQFESGKKFINIFLLQDNGNTLYFGKNTFFELDNYEITVPVEIDYINFFTKI